MELHLLITLAKEFVHAKLHIHLHFRCTIDTILCGMHYHLIMIFRSSSNKILAGNPQGS